MTPEQRRIWLGRALPWALLILFALRGVAAMRVDGTTADEPLHLAYAERGLTAGTFIRTDGTLNSKMPVSVLNALPATLAERSGTLSWPRKLFLARLPSLLLGVLLGWLVWSWAGALFGPWGGALALFLYTFCPNVLAHAHLVTTDISTALAMFGSAYAFWRYLDRPSRGRLAVAVAAFGLAQLTKTTAAFLFPIFALLLALRLRTRKDLLRAAGLLLLLALSALAVLNAGFLGEGTGTPLKGYTFVSESFQKLAATPVLRDLPLPLPYAYVQGLDMVTRDSRAQYWTYLRGRYSDTGFRSYFLWAFLLKVPVATQILLLLALGLWATGRLRAPGADDFLLVPAAFLLVYFSFFFRLGIGIRYILPAFPFLFVFAGRVAAYPPSSRSLSRWQPAAVGALLLWLAASSFSVHPQYLSYFNEIAGGPGNGWRWLLDSNLDWGQDEDYVRNVWVPRSPVPVWINPGGPIAGRVAVNLDHLIGLDPGIAERYAWLRENFRPVAKIRWTFWVFDVTEADLDRCCADRPRIVEDPDADLALSGQAAAGAEGARVRFEERLNDASLGTNDPADPARTLPPRPRPVKAWFGVLWTSPRTVGRAVAWPGFDSRGPGARRFLALDYVFQSWDGREWRDIPGTRVTGNQELRVEHRFPPRPVLGIRLLIERERNAEGAESPTGGFRAACLEIAAYER
ncbi:MAG TPA: glycosyltransferase family 39 protein [Thermoanaerobaculia bacterium]|nr:glycosyltransferase family 39 protein [Thermoanaerobaculia bacterium]